jgi:hypothetical protein
LENLHVHPSETTPTLDEGHDDLIGSRILFTSFALTNNMVLSFSELGGTYPVGACSTRSIDLYKQRRSLATSNEMKLR